METVIWAPWTETARRSTSGGVIRFGQHTWDAYSATQATQASSAGEAELYSVGSVAARGLLAKSFFLLWGSPADRAHCECIATVRLDAEFAKELVWARYGTWSCGTFGFKNDYG